MRTLIVLTVALLVSADSAMDGRRQGQDRAFLTSELIFPLEHWHNHASMVVELPDGDLLVCWFHGSGERTADDVVVRGARLRKGQRTWSEPFLLADTPGYPDTNATMFVDPKQAALAAVADDPRERVAHRADEVQDVVDYRGDGAAAVGRQRSSARDARRRVRAKS